MSHFTSVKTQLRDLSLLNAAAKALGLKRTERTTVKGYVGEKTDADYVWQVSKKYDVGAIKSEDGTYTLTADWWGTDRTIPGLAQKIRQEYGVQAVLRRAKPMGHQVVRKGQKDGSIRLVVKTR